MDDEGVLIRDNVLDELENLIGVMTNNETEDVESFVHDIEINTKFQLLSGIFPDADFEYLKQKSIEFVGKDQEFENFVSNSLVNDDIPKNEPNVVEEISLIKSLEKVQYSCEAFVKRFKDPFEYFMNYSKGADYQQQLVEYLKDRYRDITTERIQEIAVSCNYNLLQSINCLEDIPPDPSHLNDTPRKDEEIIKDFTNSDDNFQHEVFFVEHKEEILDYMKLKQDEKDYALEKAKILNELLECECCYDSEVLAEDAVTCTEGHIFCIECFQRSVDVIMGDAKVEFPCFQECSGKFPMTAVKNVLSVKAYNKLVSRIQYREVKAADIPGMEFCPYCDYGVIPAAADEIFKCQKCLAEICRKCNKDYHHPRKCHESEEEYRATQERIKSEENLTYQVVRICKQCNTEFIKDSGCNKMTCGSCGAFMCYICREIISGYDHFKGGSCSLH
ncbi:hypothetical protein O3M35_005446 [Rhynocoris fuscipes]|uniref:RING-type domain-containing protein n=1 Tax=Rhynocoris fuscipes TaxID=488301 RepID=A0AAW1DJL1_9HEMI